MEVRKKDLDSENSGEERGKGSRVGFRRRGWNANEMTKQEEIENERVEAGEWKRVVERDKFQGEKESCDRKRRGECLERERGGECDLEN